MKHITDEELNNGMTLFSTMKEVDSPDYFYTRLKARMELESTSKLLGYPVNPVLVICTLTLFLLINSVLLEKEQNIPSTDANEPIEAFAAAYDQTISH